MTIKSLDDLSEERFAGTLATLMPDGAISWAALASSSARELAANAAALGVSQ